MPYCPKCGAEVDEATVFCPKCGASLKIESSMDWTEQWRQQRKEWREKRREWRDQRRALRRQRREAEWAEKHEYVFLGPIVGGLILLLLGLLLYLAVTGSFTLEAAGALFLVFVGFVIVIAAMYAIIKTMNRHH